MDQKNQMKFIMWNLHLLTLQVQCMLVIVGGNFGDVISNLLLFNGNQVTKEYYINDYGNQIKNFVKTVFKN